MVKARQLGVFCQRGFERWIRVIEPAGGVVRLWVRVKVFVA